MSNSNSSQKVALCVVYWAPLGALDRCCVSSMPVFDDLHSVNST